MYQTLLGKLLNYILFVNIFDLACQSRKSSNNHHKNISLNGFKSIFINSSLLDEDITENEI